MDNFKKSYFIVFGLILVLYGLLLVYRIDLPAADDMARHLVNGREILHGNWHILFHNVYSYTMPDQPFINHHWLSGVVFYVLHLAIGWSGLVFFKMIVLLASFAIIFWIALKRASFWLVSLFSLPTILILSERSYLRPEIFSYLFIAIFLYLLIHFEEHPESNRIYWLVPLQIIWVNMHLFFIIGPVMVAGFLVEKFLRRNSDYLNINLDKKSKKSEIKQIDSVMISNEVLKNLATVLGMVVVACFLNPNGMDGAFVPFKIFTNYGMDVNENHSIFYFLKLYPFWTNYSILVFVPSVLILAFSFILNFKIKSVFSFLVSMSFAIGGFMIVRLIPAFGMFFLPAIAANLNGKFLNKKYFTHIAAIVIILFCGCIYFWDIKDLAREPGLGLGLTAHANDSGEFLKQNNIQGPFFNDYDGGSYLIYNLYPKERVFVDNRPEAFSEDFFNNAYLPIFNNEDAWQNSLNTYNFNAIFMYRYDKGPNVYNFVFQRVRDPEWALVYIDEDALIFVRNNEQNKDIIDKFKITPDNIQQRLDYLVKSDDYVGRVAAADNFNLVGRTDLGMEAFFDVVGEWPDAGKIWMVMGEWELSNDNPKSPLLALAYFDKAISVGHNTAEVYTWLGKAYVKIEKYDKAREALKTAIKINPERQDAVNMLKQIKDK